MTQSSRQKWLLALVGILLVTNIITLTVFFWSASGNRHPKAKEKPRLSKFLVTEMQFDSTQEAAYWKLRDSLIKKQKPIWDSIRSAKRRFYELVSLPVSNDSLVQVRANEILEQQKKLDLITLNHFQQVKTMCRPDQMAKFDTVIKEIVHRMTSFRKSTKKSSGDSSSRK